MVLPSKKDNEMNHFLDIHKTDPADLRSMIDAALKIKTARDGTPKATPDAEQPLAGHMVALIFEKPSTRTRVSFDVGVRQMGGETMVLSGGDLQLGHGETIADTARVLSRFVDLIMIRTFDESGKKVVWSGDGNNVCASWLHAAAQFGFDFTFTGPVQLDPEMEFVGLARNKGVNVTIERDPMKAVDGADLIITDTWVSMHDAQSARERRHNMLRPYQVNRHLMEAAKPDTLFMHCLPAHREEEVTSEVMDGPNSVIWDEAENRLHAQKAIMRWCLGQ